MQTPRRTPVGSVTVALRSRAPDLWGWDLCRDGGGALLQRSVACYRRPEDAWQAGQTARVASEAALRPFAMSKEEGAAAV